MIPVPPQVHSDRGRTKSARYASAAWISLTAIYCAACSEPLDQPRATVVDLGSIPVMSYSEADLRETPEWILDTDYTVLADLSTDGDDPFHGGIVSDAVAGEDGAAVFQAQAPGGVSRLPPAIFFVTSESEQPSRLPSLPNGGDAFLPMDLISMRDTVFMAGKWARYTREPQGKTGWVGVMGRGWERTREFPVDWLVAQGMFDDGSLLFETYHTEIGTEDGSAQRLKSFLRVPRETWRFDGDEPARADTLVSVGYRRETVGTPWDYETVPVAVDSDRFWVARSKDPAVTAFSADGTPLLQVEWEVSDLTVDPEVLADFLTEDGGPRSMRSGPEVEPQKLEEAARYTAVAGIAVGRDGRVFVRTRSLHPETGLPVWSRHWLMFERDGSLAGRLVQPEEVRILSFGDGDVLGTVDMPPDGQQLRRYRLVERDPSDP